MKRSKKILVSGASIAGLTLAYWLNKQGFEVTVIEKSEALRLGGQNIDVKGPAWEIVQKMGLAEKIKAANTTEVGIRFVGTDNQVVAEFPKDDALSMTQEIEILRGDFVEILYQSLKNEVTFIFGDQIKALKEQAEKVSLTFGQQPAAEFDLVLLAEGIGSATRQLVFGKEIKYNYLGLYCAYFTMEKAPTDTNWARWCNAVGAIVFLIRPDNHGTTRASICFLSPERGYEKLPADQQKKLLIDKIKDAGWEAPRIAKAIAGTEDLYLERLSQVKAPRWHKGRVAMVGDAAYCATPIAGQGTDLAVTGAYILAGELARQSEHPAAYKAYEEWMRPFVNKVQQLPPGVPRLAYPTSKLGVKILNTFFAIAGSGPAKLIAGLFKNKKEPKKESVLPF